MNSKFLNEFFNLPTLPSFLLPSSYFHSCTPLSNPDFPLDPYLKEAILPTISLVQAALTESKGVSLGYRASNFEIPEPITGKVWELEDFESHPTLLVMLKQADGSYACVAESATRYTLGETKEELLRVLGLQEEQGSSLQFLRRVLLGGKKMWSWKNLLLGVIEQLREMKAGVPMDRVHAVEPDHSQM